MTRSDDIYAARVVVPGGGAEPMVDWKCDGVSVLDAIDELDDWMERMKEATGRG